MRFKQRIAGAALAAAVTTVPLAGVLSTDGAAATLTAAGTTTVQLDVFGYDSGVQGWANSTMKSFDTSHKGLSLAITVIPPDSLEQLLTTRFQGGDPP
ncbi:MAG TPA: hypothetical protein VL984_03115, partial [Acidimicrobiales bacterium]|nr:hypothetical protein [Acidimicrobiales bacterium]